MLAMFVSISAERETDVLGVRPGSRPLDDAAVYLPYHFAVCGGRRIGDTFTASRGEDQIQLKVAGFTDAAVFGSPSYQWRRLPVTAATLENLGGTVP
jgi:hypothetical protein